MAKLIKCTDCKKKISPNAETCPNCGAPVPKNGKQKKQISTGCGCLIILLFILIIIVAVYNSVNEDSGETPSQRPSPTTEPQPQPTNTPPEEPKEKPTAAPAPTITPEPTTAISEPEENMDAIRQVANYTMPSGEKLREYLASHAMQQPDPFVYGWYTFSYSEGDGTYVTYKYRTGLGDRTPIWFVRSDLSLVTFANGHAKGITPELIGDASSGLAQALEYFEGVTKQSTDYIPDTLIKPIVTPTPTPLPPQLEISRYDSAFEAIATFGDYDTEDKMIEVIQENPLHIKIYTLEPQGNFEDLVKEAIKRSLVEGVFRAFIHTDIDQITLTSVPRELVKKDGKFVVSEQPLEAYEETLTLTRNHAEAVAKEFFQVENLDGLIMTREVSGMMFANDWIDSFSNSLYEEKVEALFNALKQP